MENRNCLDMMKTVTNIFRRDLDNVLRERNITMSQMSALMTLRDDMGGECDMKSLEKRLMVAQSTVAVMISKLEAKGMVSSCTDPEDRRVKQVRLTSRGEDICRDMEGIVHAMKSKALSDISDEEKRVLSGILSRVYRNMTGEISPEGGVPNA